MSAINFESTTYKASEAEKIASGVLVSLPVSASKQLPSRGMVYVKGTLNDTSFEAALEPDGKGSHWFKVSQPILETSNIEVGDTVSLSIEPTKDWPEPKVPSDLAKALAESPAADKVWQDITPMARWDWIRWVGSTRNPETRQHHVEVGISKLSSGMRRPCCFNRSGCTLTDA